MFMRPTLHYAYKNNDYLNLGFLSPFNLLLTLLLFLRYQRHFIFFAFDMPILVVWIRSFFSRVDSLGEIHKDLLFKTSSESKEMSMPNDLVTRPGPEANLSFFLEIKTDLINTPLAKFSFSVTIFKQWWMP